jgi:hypothetical protein
MSNNYLTQIFDHQHLFDIWIWLFEKLFTNKYIHEHLHTIVKLTQLKYIYIIIAQIQQTDEQHTRHISKSAGKIVASASLSKYISMYFGPWEFSLRVKRQIDEFVVVLFADCRSSFLDFFPCPSHTQKSLCDCAEMRESFYMYIIFSLPIYAILKDRYLKCNPF